MVLTDEQVREIHKRVSSESFASLAKAFSVSKGTVINIAYARCRKHLGLIPHESFAWRAPKYGEANGSSRLTEQKVRAIRKAHKSGRSSQGKLAKKYGVSQVAIHKIVTGKTWSHVDHAIS